MREAEILEVMAVAIRSYRMSDKCSMQEAILTALSSAGIDCEGWRTIESAPKDGTEILVPYPIYKKGLTNEIEEYRIIIVFWKSVGWDTGVWMLHEEPKHWRPLPLPPLASGGG